MNKPPEQVLRDEAEMRAFYASCGISPQTIEAAIKARRDQLVREEAKTAARTDGCTKSGPPPRGPSGDQ
jgi:hypothetical protein